MNPANSKRIEALDVLRGLTVALMILVNNSGDSYACLHHSDWNGLTLCDMVFPFFLFIVGVSCYLSLYKGGFKADGKTLARIGKRTLMIILICWGIFWISRIVKGDFLPFDHFRLTGVLVRIALVYGLLSLLAVSVNHKYMPWIAIALLAVYSAALLLGNGYVNDSTNIVVRVDHFLLGENHLYTKRPVDPEGLLGVIPSLAHGIIGFMFGMVLRSPETLTKKMKSIALWGAVLVGAGLLLSMVMPLNKRIWSPSYVLFTCGAAALVLDMLMYLIDYRSVRFFTHPFLALGTNALAVYVLSEVLEVVFGAAGITDACQNALRGLFPSVQLADFCYALLFVLLNYAVAEVLYRRHIIIKL